MEVRRQLAADDTIARLPYTSPRDPEPGRLNKSGHRDAKPEDDETRRADSDAVDTAVDPMSEELPHVPAKLRQKMLDDPVFARAGWGREDTSARDEDPDDQPPLDDSDPDAASQSVNPIEEPPTKPKPVDDANTPSGRRDHIGDPEPDQPADAGQDPPTDPDAAKSRSLHDERTDTSHDGRRTVEAEMVADRGAGGDSGDRHTEPPASESEPDRSIEGGEAREHEFVEDADPQDMETYRRIRETDDVDAVADNSGFPREVVEVAKENLFVRTHDVAVNPGVVRHGHFTPLRQVAPLWERVASGAALAADERAEMWSLLAHEYVEAKLMEAGLPYLLADPDAWDACGHKVAREYPAAHTVAPRSLQSIKKDLLAHWEKLLIPRGDVRVADDLSNLDAVVRLAKEGLGL
ncbi:hypothetical protein ACFV9C_08925 [Kribbella sp. NPDC059898]|uniref:hypothetical protein n=1 Tax=Kribbella sp. NPDC059898 TaxID=3346995 RepID=UPI003654C062